MRPSLRKNIFTIAFVLMGAGYFVFQAPAASAQVGAVKAISTTVADLPAKMAQVKQTFLDAIVKSAKFTFANSMRTLVNQIAYDTATWVGSGDKGQKPLYFTEPFAPWLAKQGANAAGQFIEEFAKTQNGEFIKKYGICSPNFSVQVKISLGLTDYLNEGRGLNDPRCSLKQIWENGSRLVDNYTDPQYLANLSAVSFDPISTDLGAALTIFGKTYETKSAELYGKELERKEGEGWLNIRSLVSGKIIAPPGTQQQVIKNANDLQTGNLLKQTGDIFVDAANIFLNQLALSAFNKLMANLNRDTGNGTSSGNYFAEGGSGGVTEIARKNSTILQAKFTERADYDLMSQLTTCNDESTPGPTNCVINQQFAQAINGHLTVAQAINKGLLNGNARVGYNANGNEMSYKDGYPYRSLIILRKYRVLPVGWEVAAQYMKNHAEETKQVTLNDLIACYENDVTYPGLNADWCRGLVDPNWVLKLPQLFCGMEGYGSEILGANVFKDAENGTSQVTVNRNNAYCADEQSCIKEGANGSCEQYGYCTEEKRQWTFGQENDNTCEPRNNTCQTFTNEGGQSFSYLENTLNYGDCDANQVGCKRYASAVSSYNTATKKVTWNPDAGQRYFNKNIEQCEASGEGCKEFIRINDNLTTNLIGDGSFEQIVCNTGNQQQGEGDAPGSGTAACQLNPIGAPGGALPDGRWYIRANGSVQAGVVKTQAIDGSQSLYIEGNGGLYSKDSGTPSILPGGFKMETDTYYTLTASLYITSGKVKIGFGGVNGLSKEVSVQNAWTQEVVVFYNAASVDAHDFYIEGTDGSAKFFVDAVQLTKGRSEGGYSEYGLSNSIYQKVIPQYLEASCYVGTRGDNESEFRLKDNAPAECFQFARKCSAGEVGCQAYTSSTTGIQVTGKVKTKDLCPESCVGYDTFVQQSNNFYPKQAAFFIPDTARTCGARSVGCTAFTNLDKLDAGGEAVEYYTEMRACMKPNAAECGQFYTWEGSDESGYQLRVYSLNKVLNGGSEEPKSTMAAADESRICNADVFKKLPTEAGYNYDCREFYAQDGSVSYHLFAKTISCSEDCHPYRREATESLCRSTGGTWDSQGRCIYNAIPGEGTTCSAPEVGCQEYTGNIANNTQDLFASTFEASNDDWNNGVRPTVTNSTALSLGGHSLSGNTFTKTVGESVARGLSYKISFLAKSASGTVSLSALELRNAAGQISSFDTTGSAFPTEWKLYSFNLSNLDHDVTSSDEANPETLRLAFSGTVYIDNVTLTAVPNRYYLIQNSWNTPQECDQDFAQNPSAGYMLGCSRYQKADNSTVTLHSFSGLCDDTAAGCEAMIDTKNSSGPTGFGKELVNDANGNGTCDPAEKECIETPADSIVNVVYDKTKLCGSANKGCQRFGLASTYETTTTFSDVYLKNDPDQYGRAVCKATGIGCSQWTTSPDNGAAYFKDPGDEVCEWRRQEGTSNVFKWFKKRTAGQTGDIACPVTSQKTIGLGGKGNLVEQPSQWAGTCEPVQAGCTEYIDPVSKFNDNLILNPSYKKALNEDRADNWTKASPAATEATQAISLTPQTMYILKDPVTDSGDPSRNDNGTSATARVKLTCPGANLMVLGEDNLFKSAASIEYSTKANSSTQFYIPLTNGSYTPVSCRVTRTNLAYGADTVYLRQAITAYQLRQNLDRSSHNNLVNFDQGAILFNERTQSGAGKAKLSFNADATYETGVDGASPSASGNKNANVLLKVQPDRVCSKWLDCLTYIPDPANPNNKVCLDIGECEAFAADGSCASRVSPERRNQNQDNTVIGNLSGYSKIGYKGESLTDYYRLSSMTQVGASVEVKNGGFEAGNAPGELEHFTYTGNASLISEPQGLDKLQPLYKVAQQRDVRFLAPEGTNVASLGSGAKLKTDPIDMQIGQRYVLSFYSYGQGGDLNIKLATAGKPDVDILKVSGKDQANQWVRRSIGFRATSDSHSIVFESVNNFSYIDDIGIDISLNVRCDDPNADPSRCVTPTTNANDAQPQYIAPSCRLYPNENSLACTYTDENDITSQGIKGYCLESDPRNPAVCLLWYPVDRIASDAAEEGAAVNFNNSVYYCIDAKDECSAEQTPQMYCNKFVKVDTDKYWAGRLSSTSTLTLPKDPDFSSGYFYPSDTRKIDFGGKAGPSIAIGPITANRTESFFGSRYREEDLNSKQIIAVNSNGNLATFMPYYGTIAQNKCSQAGTNVYPAFNAPDYQFYGHVNGSGNSSHPNLGQWDFCAAARAARVDFDEDRCSGEECKYRHIDETFQTADCGPDATNCAVDGVTCSTQGNNGNWNGVVSDTSSDSDDPACVFYCYNRIKEVSVTKTGTPEPDRNAMDVIRRLFPGTPNWQVYTWNGSTYSPSPSTPGTFVQPYDLQECPPSGRPPVVYGSNADYCYINPLLSNFMINGKSKATDPAIYVNQRGYVTFSYHTKTDIEQLPLKTITIDFGYSDENGKVRYTFSNANFADINPRYYNKLYEYGEINNGSNQPITDPRQCNGAASCFKLTPKITITDNWGKCSCINSSASTCTNDAGTICTNINSGTDAMQVIVKE